MAEALTASLSCVYGYDAVDVRVARKGAGNVYPIVSKRVNGVVAVHWTDGQGSVLVLVEAEVLRRLAESAIACYNQNVDELIIPRAVQLIPPKGRRDPVRVRMV